MGYNTLPKCVSGKFDGKKLQTFEARFMAHLLWTNNLG